MKEEGDGKDQGWKNDIEEILACMKEISKCQKEKEDDKTKDVDDDKANGLQQQNKNIPEKAGTNAAAPQRSKRKT